MTFSSKPLSVVLKPDKFIAPKQLHTSPNGDALQSGQVGVTLVQRGKKKRPQCSQKGLEGQRREYLREMSRADDQCKTADRGSAIRSIGKLAICSSATHLTNMLPRVSSGFWLIPYESASSMVNSKCPKLTLIIYNPFWILLNKKIQNFLISLPML